MYGTDIGMHPPFCIYLFIQRLRAIALKENDPNVALRVAVESGGCHGYQYKIDLTNLSESTGD